MKHILLLTAGMALFASQPIVAQEPVSNSIKAFASGPDQTDWPILDQHFSGDASYLIEDGWEFKNYEDGADFIIKAGGSFTTPPSKD